MVRQGNEWSCGCGYHEDHAVGEDFHGKECPDCGQRMGLQIGATVEGLELRRRGIRPRARVARFVASRGESLVYFIPGCAKTADAPWGCSSAGRALQWH